LLITISWISGSIVGSATKFSMWTPTATKQLTFQKISILPLQIPFKFYSYVFFLIQMFNLFLILNIFFVYYVWQSIKICLCKILLFRRFSFLFFSAFHRTRCVFVRSSKLGLVVKFVTVGSRWNERSPAVHVIQFFKRFLFIFLARRGKWKVSLHSFELRPQMQREWIVSFIFIYFSRLL